MTTRGTCKLCLTKADLHDSHIIPEFCYKSAYDSKHRATQTVLDPERTKLLQKGLREPILCGACEQKIGKLESYFAGLWYSKKALTTPFPELQTLTGLDYDRFKCFHLSILWRASVSSGEAFNTVDLGVRHQERLRKVVLSGSGGAEDEYPFWCYVVVAPDGHVVHDLIAKPGRSKFEGHTAYYIIYAGCEWVFFISNHSKKPLLKAALSRSGSINLVRRNLMETIAIRRFQADRSSAGA